jgi:hypothetical protein
MANELAGRTARQTTVATTTADLVDCEACDPVLIPGAACPIPAFLAERLLPPPPVPPAHRVVAVGRGRRGGAAA